MNITSKVIAPTLPTNIEIINISLLNVDRLGVIPSERPTVLNAEKDSKAIAMRPFSLSLMPLAVSKDLP